MAAVVFVSSDASLMVTLIDGLESAGLKITWAAPKDAEPGRQKTPPDALVLDGDSLPTGLPELIKRWRAVDPAPAIVLVGGGAAPKLARDLTLPHLPRPLDADALGQLVARAAAGRFVGALTPGAALRALGLTPSGDAKQDAIVVASGSSRVDPALVRDALRPFADHYVTIGPALELLREHRALSIPETNLCMSLDGTRTLRRVAETGGLEPLAALRCVWALASTGIMALTAEPPDDRHHPAARLVARARRRLKARGERMAQARTHFDILDIPPDHERAPSLVDAAVRALGVWYAPERLAGMDLGPLGPMVDSYWQWIDKAATTLRDPSTCRRYFFWLIERGIAVDQLQTEARQAEAEAEPLFAAGQQALAEGEAFRALSQLAQAARLKPDEPDYEAYAGWARYMAEVARGNDGRQVLLRELATVEQALLGRRPRPRALYCMGLMAQVSGDLEVARAYLTDALACDPTLAAAQRALSRLPRHTSVTAVSDPS